MNSADPITRLNTALEGRYRIESELGEGGMATVYLATDLKHNRNVALKVLKPELAAVVGAERFLAEIETTANLQHPHILPLFDSGEADSFLFYVMPYVEGETLRDKLNRDRQLPIDEAVRIATNVAEALDYAHRQGVIHRDIKPANILLQDGNPVIADFGIALAVGTAGQGRLTETGLSLGTPHYMSPEQALGDQRVGPAADIYALGTVLYEMLVGEPPFTGSTAQAILGKIIAGDPASAADERASVPGNVDAAIRKALERLPADRFVSAADFATATNDPQYSHGPAGVALGTQEAVGRWKRRAVGITALFVATAVALAWVLVQPDSPKPETIAVFDLGVDVTGASSARMPAITPEGSAVIFPGALEGERPMLFVRWMNDLRPSLIPGTELASRPTVSPSGEEVAFLDDRGSIRAVPIRGGVARTLVDSFAVGASWGADGYVYYTSLGEVYRVSGTGVATPERMTGLLPGERRHFDFQVWPERGVAVFGVVDADRLKHLVALRLATGERKTLTLGSKPTLTPDGQIVFGSADGSLLVAPFDPEAMELSGPPQLIVDGVALTGGGRPIYSLSASGVLVYEPGERLGQAGEREFVWVTRSGDETTVDPGHRFVPALQDPSFRLSPDGSRVAFSRHVDGNDDLWIKTLPDGGMTRFTFDPGQDNRAQWSPDGQRIVFRSERGVESAALQFRIWEKRADGSGEAELLFDGINSTVRVNSALGLLSPDREWLILRTGGIGAERDLFGLRLGVDSVAAPLFAEVGVNEEQPSISRDGKWMAYASNETGILEIYVRPFPNVNDGHWQVSEGGGIQPIWAHGGQELFFVNPRTRELMAAEFTTTSTAFVRRRPTTLFEIPPSLYVGPGNAEFYDVHPDDERFLMVKDPMVEETGRPDRLVLIQNFFEELKRLVPN